MKPAAFELETPRSLAEALALLNARDDVKVLAGGQSLVPLMNFRLARPSVLVDLNRVPELSYIRVADDGVLAIGAMTRQRTLERSADVAERAPLIHAVLPWVGHPPIRNRGTIGGSLAHADSAAELCVAALALDATVVAASARGDRTIPITDFFVGPFTTCLRADEILTQVRIPPLPAGTGVGFEEVARRRGDFAMVAVSAVLQVNADVRIIDARLAYLSMGPKPLRAPAAERWLAGQTATPPVFDEAAARAMTELDPAEDLHASRDYRLHVARALTRRALLRALESSDTRSTKMQP